MKFSTLVTVVSEVILRNRARCKRCDDTVESYNRHDFVYCKCRAIAVDGGRDYLRRVGAPVDFDDLSEVESEGDNGKIISKSL